MITDDLTLLLIVILSGSAALFLGKHLTDWLLELYYLGQMANQQKFYAAYDRCADRSTFELLSSLSPARSTIPQNYQDYLQFLDDHRQEAYSFYFRHLSEITLYSSVILLGCVVIPLNLAESHYWVYLIFPAVLALQILHARLVGKKNRTMYKLVVMWGIILGISMRKG